MTWRFFDYLCDFPGCRDYAPFGFGVSVLRGIRGRWFCGAHIPAEEKAPAAVTAASMRVAQEGAPSARAAPAAPIAATLFEAALIAENRGRPNSPATQPGNVNGKFG